MRRREFITLLGGAIAWPLVARAQQPAMPVIGFLDGQSFDLRLMTVFRQALKDAGYIEGRNVAIYFRSADGQTDRLITLAGDIVGRRVAAIVTMGFPLGTAREQWSATALEREDLERRKLEAAVRDDAVAHCRSLIARYTRTP